MRRFWSLLAHSATVAWLQNRVHHSTFNAFKSSVPLPASGFAYQGLEHTYFTHCSGGMASALQVLEIAHTHFWMSERKPVSPGSSSVSRNGYIFSRPSVGRRPSVTACHVAKLTLIISSR